MGIGRLTRCAGPVMSAGTFFAYSKWEDALTVLLFMPRYVPWMRVIPQTIILSQPKRGSSGVPIAIPNQPLKRPHFHPRSSQFKFLYVILSHFAISMCLYQLFPFCNHSCGNPAFVAHFPKPKALGFPHLFGAAHPIAMPSLSDRRNSSGLHLQSFTARLGLGPAGRVVRAASLRCGGVNGAEFN